MATEAFIVRAEVEFVHKIDHLAESLDRSRNYLVNLALKEYLEQHAWQIEKITQGMAVADRGELVRHDHVLRELENLIASKIKGNM